MDWQTPAVGLPARDLSYFVGTSLNVDHQMAGERKLVEAYDGRLVSRDVQGYDVDECWRDYQLGLQIRLLTTLGSAFSGATGRGDDMALVMVERGCRAICDPGLLDQIAGGA